MGELELERQAGACRRMELERERREGAMRRGQIQQLERAEVCRVKVGVQEHVEQRKLDLTHGLQAALDQDPALSSGHLHRHRLGLRFGLQHSKVSGV